MAVPNNNFTGLEDIEIALRNMDIQKDSIVYKFYDNFTLFNESKVLITEENDKVEVNITLTFDKLQRLNKEKKNER